MSYNAARTLFIFALGCSACSSAAFDSPFTVQQGDDSGQDGKDAGSVLAETVIQDAGNVADGNPADSLDSNSNNCGNETCGNGEICCTNTGYPRCKASCYIPVNGIDCQSTLDCPDSAPVCCGDFYAFESQPGLGMCSSAGIITAKCTAETACPSTAPTTPENKIGHSCVDTNQNIVNDFQAIVCKSKAECGYYGPKADCCYALNDRPENTYCVPNPMSFVVKCL